jgi:hypothetical protein
LAFILNSARLLPRMEPMIKPAMGDEARENTLAKAA